MAPAQCPPLPSAEHTSRAPTTHSTNNNPGTFSTTGTSRSMLEGSMTVAEDTSHQARDGVWVDTIDAASGEERLPGPDHVPDRIRYKQLKTNRNTMDSKPLGTSLVVASCSSIACSDQGM